jgi:hypothetical protein
MGRTGLALSCVAVLALTAGVASAHKTSTKSKVIITNAITTDMGASFDFLGVITSDKASCEKNRKVKLFFVDEKAGPQPMGTDQDADATWEVNVPEPPSGNYIARVIKKVGGSGNHRHVCKADDSKPFNFE